jgi:uncharacterized Zn finger protein
MFSLSEEDIRRLADSSSYQRGLEYYRSGAVLSVERMGSGIVAEVEGSGPEPYNVTLEVGSDGAISAECDCPYDWGGWCKHMVAAALACAGKPELASEPSALESALAALDRDSLLNLILDLAKENARFRADAEAAALRLAVRTHPPSADSPSSAAPVDVQTVRKAVRFAVKQAVRALEDYYEDDIGTTLEDEILPLLEPVEKAVEAGQGRNGLPILEAVTDELLDQWDRLEEYGAEANDLFDLLGRLWAEALLTAGLAEPERKSWAARLKQWLESAYSAGGTKGLTAAHEAARQGWDYPPLVRAMGGEITERGAWEGKAPTGAGILADARLNVLEREGRLEEAANLAEAEGQDRRHLELLVRLGRYDTAAARARELLVLASDAFAVGQRLREAGQTPLARDVAAFGLSLQGPKHDLAAWLRGLAATEIHPPDKETAVRAGLVALGEGPRLDDYSALRKVAGEKWPEVREKALTIVRRSGAYSASGQVDILLSEGMVVEALDAAEAGWDYDLLGRVVEKAAAVVPERAIHISESKAADIMDAGKADRYDYAAQWVARARDAYRAMGAETLWQDYKRSLLEKHARKYKLVPMLQRL